MAINKIMIVDDQQIFRVLLREILSDVPDFELVGEASGAQEAIDMAEDLEPDVVLMDIELNGRMNGIEAGKVIKRRKPRTGIVLFSAQKSSDFIVNAGGWSYLLKNNVGNIETLINAINGAAWGLQIIDPEVVEAIESANSDPTRGVEDSILFISQAIDSLGISTSESTKREPEQSFVDDVSVKGIAYSAPASPLAGMTPEQMSRVIQFTLDGYTDEYISDELRVNVTQIQDWRNLISDELGIERIAGIDPKIGFLEGCLRYLRQSEFAGQNVGTHESTKLLDLRSMPDEGKEVLKQVSQGWDNTSIAERMHIEEALVQEYLNVVYSILGIKLDSQIDPRMIAARVYIEVSPESLVDGA